MAIFLQDPIADRGVSSAATSGDLLTPSEMAVLAAAPMLASRESSAQNPAQQWWNLPAKEAAGRRIAAEEQAKFRGHHNDAGDAMRHAEWSQRMANEIDPVFSRLAGYEHEGENILGAVADIIPRVGRVISPSAYPPRTSPIPSLGQTLAESRMDLHNNAVGIDAATARRPIAPSALQVRPAAPPY